VSAKTVRRAAREVAGEIRRPPRRLRVGAVIAAMFAVLVVFAGAAGFAGAWRLPTLRALRNIHLTAAPEPARTFTLAPPTEPTPTGTPIADAAPAASPVATAPAPVASPSAAPAPMASMSAARTAPDLDALLTATRPPADLAGALTRVLARWGVTVPPGEDPCRMATRSGLECYDGRGTWMVVRRLRVPLALKLTGSDGTRHFVAATALEDDTVTLQWAQRTELLPTTAVERWWDGSFSVIWRPLPGVARVLAPGMQGPGVAWLRRALNDGDITGRERGPVVYDDALAARVIAFQRREGLEADGIAGIETLVRLSTQLDTRAPLLAGARPGR
jgi:general secretion pathway protein A